MTNDKPATIVQLPETSTPTKHCILQSDFAIASRAFNARPQAINIRAHGTAKSMSVTRYMLRIIARWELIGANRQLHSKVALSEPRRILTSASDRSGTGESDASQ